MTNWRITIQDLLEHSPARWLLFTRRRWLLVGALLLAMAVVGVGGGWLIAEVGALPVLALLVGLGYVAWVLRDIEIAYLGVIGIIALLPFASVPFDLGFTPTFLDLTLLALFAVWALPYILGEEQRFVMTPVGGAVLAFMLMAIGAFVSGLSHGALTSYLVRHFAEVLLSIALFYLVVNTVRDVARLRSLMRWVVLGATAAALLGIGLYFLPDELAIRILSALGRFGYPTGSGVLWYIRDDPTLMQRATSTSVHPNVLGSLLNVALAMAAPQLFARRPFLPRWLLLGAMGVMGLGLGLTVSRGSMLGLAVAVTVLAGLRYRKLLPLMGVGLLLFLVLPWTQGLVTHFVEGFLQEDLSTQMRMGEYKDTFTLIARYPVLGVGFAGAPDIDIYVAVASVYLLIAAQMGLVGLVTFLVIMGTVLARFWRRRVAVGCHPELEPLWYGIHAAIIGGLVGGVFDHYFFSLDFHHSVTLFWLLVGLATAATEMIGVRSEE
ncbi:MAG TPA: O-antigen ligase family protein [Anaerolineae bacterium]|nr:O-antigen ligase family protein [Anaerolineae bacterium]